MIEHELDPAEYAGIGPIWYWDRYSVEKDEDELLLPLLQRSTPTIYALSVTSPHPLEE
jgi:hypothetical protein